MLVRPRRRLLVRLLAGTIAPTVVVLAVFGFFAHERARRELENELGRRLATAAAGAAAMLLPEQLRALGVGDEDTLTYANVRRRLEVARARLGVRRVLAVTPELDGRGDTSGELALGARAHEIEADGVELAQAAAGRPASSPLFIGHDGIPYKRAYAAVGEPGDVAGFVAVEATADYPATLAAFRRSLIVAGALALIAVLGLTIWIASRISGPVARLADAAARLGRGDLDARIPIETGDEIGVLAQTLEETRDALRARDERMQMMLAGIAHEVRNPLGGLELYAGLLRDALGDQPERLEEVARIEREVGHLKTVVTEFLDFARRAAPRLESVRLAALFDEVRELTGAGDGTQSPRPLLPRWRQRPIRDSSGACSSIWLGTRWLPRAVATWRYQREASSAVFASRCATTAPVCRPTCARRSSRHSSPPAKRGPDWGWPSFARSCATTAAMSWYETRRAAVPCSRSICPQPRQQGRHEQHPRPHRSPVPRARPRPRSPGVARPTGEHPGRPRARARRRRDHRGAPPRHRRRNRSGARARVSRRHGRPVRASGAARSGHGHVAPKRRGRRAGGRRGRRGRRGGDDRPSRKRLRPRPPARPPRRSRSRHGLLSASTTPPLPPKPLGAAGPNGC